MASFSALFLALPALAQEAEGAEIKEFYWGELIGAVIAIIVLVKFIMIAKKTGGLLGSMFKIFATAVGLFTFAFVFRAYTEITGMESTLFVELLFEGALYLGMLVFMIGAFKADEIYKQ